MNIYAWPGQIACLITILSIILGCIIGRRRFAFTTQPPSPDPTTQHPASPAITLWPGILLTLASALALAAITPRDQAITSILLALASGLLVQIMPRLVSSSALAALMGLTIPTIAWLYLTTTIPAGFASGQVTDANRLAAELTRWPLTLLAPIATGALASLLAIALQPAALALAGRSTPAPLTDAQPRTLVAIGCVAGLITPLIALTCAMHAGRMMQLGFEAPTTDRYLLILAASESAAFAITASAVVLAMSQIAGVPSLAFTAIACLAGGIIARIVLPASFPSDVEVRYKDLLIDIMPRLVSIIGAMLVIGSWLGGPRRVPAILLIVAMPLALGFSGAFNSKLPWHWTLLTALSALALAPLLVAAAQEVSRASDPSELSRPPQALPRLLPAMYIGLAIAAICASLVSLLGSSLPASLSLAELDWQTKAPTPGQWWSQVWAAQASNPAGAHALSRGLLGGIIIAIIATSIALVLLRNLGGAVLQPAGTTGQDKTPPRQHLPAWAVVILCLLPLILVIALKFAIQDPALHHAAAVSLSLCSLAMLIIVAAAPPPPSITQPPAASLELQAMAKPTLVSAADRHQGWPAIGLIGVSLSMAAIILTAA